MRSVKSDRKPTVATIPPFRTTLAELGSELGLLSVSGELDLYVAEDLRECERILTVAAQHGVSWHFEMDI